jgi:hypothetical protein
MRQWKTSYQHAQHWLKNNTQRDVIECVLNYTLTYARKRVKLDSEHWYEHLPESLETSHAGKVTILWNQQL